MILRRTVTIILFFMLFGVQVVAQETDTRPTLGVDDTVTIRLEPDEQITYHLEHAFVQSILVETDSDMDHSVSLADIDGQAIYPQTIMREDQRFVGRITFSPSESDVTDDLSFTIQLTNTDDNSGEVTLTVTETEAYTIEIGDIYTIDAESPPILELRFAGEADQQITVEASSPQIRYAIEYFDADGRVHSLLPNGNNLHPVTGITLDRDWLYHVVVQMMPDPDAEPLTERQIHIRLTRDYFDEITVGETRDGSISPAHFQFDFDLEPLQGVRVRFESDGAQTYITDADENVLAFSGHGAIPREVNQIDMIAPVSGTYTIHAYNPEMVDLFAGEFTLSVESIEIPQLTDGLTRMALERSPGQLMLAEVQPGTSYELSLENPEDTDGGVRVRVYALTGETILQESSANDLSATYTFAVDDEDIIGVELTLLNAPEAAIDLQLIPVETDN